MKITVDAEMAKALLKRYNRDYYTFEGLETIIDYYDELDENMEFDVIAICCDCSQFGENCCFSFSDMIAEYEVMTIDEYADSWYDMDEDEKVCAIVGELERRTTVLHVSNGNYIVFNF